MLRYKSLEGVEVIRTREWCHTRHPSGRVLTSPLPPKENPHINQISSEVFDRLWEDAYDAEPLKVMAWDDDEEIARKQALIQENL